MRFPAWVDVTARHHCGEFVFGSEVDAMQLVDRACRAEDDQRLERRARIDAQKELREARRDLRELRRRIAANG
jgi:hypothetical protein